MPNFLAMLLATGLLAIPAAVPPERVALEQMRQKPPYQQAIDTIYQTFESSLPSHCKSINLDKASRQARVWEPLQVDAGGNIVRGSWAEQADGMPCGEKRHYLAVVKFFEGKPYILPRIPGETIASPALQHDALVKLAASITLAGGKCPPQVLETSLPDSLSKRKGLPWKEVWLVQSCDQRDAVLMHFVPDATGGISINISPEDISLLMWM